MELREHLEEWLRREGYDGLYADECGCVIGDLAPCEGCPLDCEPGVRVDPPPDGYDLWVGPRPAGDPAGDGPSEWGGES